MATRTEIIDAKASDLVKNKHQGWNIRAAREFAASLPPANDADATCNGWPVVTREGVRVSLQLAVDRGASCAFAKPGKLD